ncbi:MAG: hypothetical protein KDK39_15710 [Leptospiraceae bacterium]|nr:hypothetical protein [Leptospiraceae bacterium]
MHNSSNKILYGIDLSGLANQKTKIVKCEEHANSVEFSLITKNPFSVPRKGNFFIGDDSLSPYVEFIKQIVYESDGVYVDIPLDLQDLPNPKDPHYLWQCSLRPIDKALGGLAPLGNFIGTPLAQFRFLLNEAQLFSQIGEKIFETYPKASLELLYVKGLQKNVPKYKSLAALYKNNNWEGINNGVADIANFLNIKSHNGVQIDDDILDAIICCLAGLNDYTFKDGDLNSYMLSCLPESRLNPEKIEIPKGYRLAYITSRPEKEFIFIN